MRKKLWKKTPKKPLKAKKPPYTPKKVTQKQKKATYPLIAVLKMSSEMAISELQRVGLIRGDAECGCGKKMSLKEKAGSDSMRYKCSKCKSAKSIYYDSILEGSKMSPEQALGLVWSFGNDTPVTDAVNVIGISKPVAVKYYTCFRGLVARYLEKEQAKWKIGGSGSIVEADEVCIGHVAKQLPHEKKKTKNYVVPHGEWWGATSRGENNLILQELPRKPRLGPASKEDVIPLLKKYVKSGTIVMTDGLKAYRCVGGRHRFLTLCEIKYLVLGVVGIAS